ncbi:MAG TPA: ribokinase [Bryobacteraceae bacterium]|jgi:ribokinase|nr:ribokinase [Bryobacteraceae bacterium]
MPRIVVIGSANIDLTTFTDQFPRPGETIFGRDFSLGFGGKGANQAVAARNCGADVAMVARVGDDMFGEATIENFKKLGIDTSRVLMTPGVSTGVAPIFVDSAGQNRILVVKGANDRLTPEDVYAAKDVILSADAVVFQLEIPLLTTIIALQFAKKHGIRTIFNPAPAQILDLKELGSADYVIPNEIEAEVISGMPVRNLDEARLCAKKLLDGGLNRVVITLGANGALLGEQHVAPFAVEPVDTTGAGDAFIGSLAVFLSSGYSELELEAISRANLYAALSTLSIGTQKSFVDADRFNREWQRRSG